MTGELPRLLPPGFDEPQGPTKPSFTPSPELMRGMMAGVGYELSQSEKPLYSKALDFGEAVAKSAADGVAHLASLAFRSSMAFAQLRKGSLSGAGQAWDTSGQILKDLTGTESPGALDFVSALPGMPKAQVFDPYTGKLREVTYSEAADQSLQSSIGNLKIAADAIGMVASFAGAPGRALGEVGQAAARPLGQAVERSIAKTLLKDAARRELVDPETIDRLISSGRGLELLAKMPEWRASAGTAKALFNLGGRNITDIMSTGAANMVQAYGLLPDEQRFEGAWLGAVTAPLAVPLARVGDRLAQKVMAWRLTPDQAQAAKNVYRSLEDGRLSMQKAVQQWNNIVPHVNRAGAAIMSGAFEGTSMMMLDPSAWDLTWRWADGDSEAGAQLLAMLAGSAAGTAAIKYGIPMEMAPLFRELRPDINTLDTVLWAKAAEDVAAETAARGKQKPVAVEEYVAPGMQQEARAQEPQKPTKAKQEPKVPAVPDQPFEGFPQEIATPDTEAPYRTEDPLGAMQEAAIQSRLEARQAELKQRYGWAEQASQPLLRAGFKATIVDDGTIQFTLGRDHTVVLANRDGQVVVDLKPETVQLFKRFDRPMEGYELINPTTMRFTGNDASRALDTLTLMAQFSQMDFDLDMAVMGRTQVENRPEWYGEGDGRYYQAQLDGSRLVTDSQGGMSVENVVPIRKFDDMDVIYQSETLDVLTQTVASKMAVAPDPLVDGILTNAILMARHSRSRGGDALRAFFDRHSPQDLAATVRDGVDRALAFELGSLATGNNNPGFAANEFRALIQGMDARVAGAEGRRVTEEWTSKVNQQIESVVSERQAMQADTERRTDVGMEYASMLEGAAEQQRMEAAQEAERAKEMRSQQAKQEYATALEEYAAQEAEALSALQTEPTAEQKKYQRDTLAKETVNRNLRKDDVVEVPITELGARRLYEIGSKKSALGKQLAKVLQAKKGGMIRVTWSEFQSLARTWSKYANKDLANMTPEAQKAMKSANQSSDFWMSETLKAFGQREKFIMDALAGKTAESGSLKPMTREEAERLASMAERVADYFLTPQKDLLVGKGDDAYAAETRLASADWRTNVGKLQPALAKVEKSAKKARKALFDVVPDAAGGDTYRWIALVDGRVEPRNNVERKFQQDAQALVREAYAMLREAGAVRRYRNEQGEDVIEPLGEPKQTVMPRMISGKGWENLQNDAFRSDFLNEVIRQNDLTKTEVVDGKKVQRPMTEQEAQDLIFGKVSATETSDPNRQAAVEFRREIEWFPAVYKGKEILDSDIFQSMKRLVHNQAGRSATLKRWGPDLTTAERKVLAENFPEFDVSRPGVKARLQSFVEKMRFKGDTADVARNLITSLEGGTPQKTGEIIRAIYELDAVPRSLLTSASFVHDTLDYVNRGVMYGGLVRGAKYALDVVTSPRELIALAERMGTVLRGTGSGDPTEAVSWWRKIADTASSVGTFTEKLKTGYLTRVGESMLADWKKGKSIENDRWVVGEMLRFGADEKEALLSGKASPDLQNAFLQEFVQLGTSRRLSHEGSRFAANPQVKALMRFTNWATGNLMSTARLYKSLGQDAFSGDPKRMMSASVRAAKHAVGTTVSGLIGQMLSYAIADLFRGENGFERFFNELSYAPEQMLLKAYMGQVTGGPYATMMSAASRPDDARTWTSFTTPTALLYSLYKAAQSVDASSPGALAKTLPDAVVEFQKEALLPSWGKNAINTMTGAGMIESDPRARTARRMASSFMRLEGIEQANFPRNKPDEYYDAMRSVAKAVSKYSDDPAKAWSVAEADIRTALGLAPEDSVAATLRSYRMLDRIPDDKLDAFTKFVGDDQMRYIVAHDEALRTLAKFAALKEGTPIGEFDSALATAENQARLGNTRLWGRLVERAVDEATERMAVGEPIGENILDLSQSIAAFPEQQDWMTEAQRKMLMRRATPAERSKYVERILVARARNRKKSLAENRKAMEQQYGVELNR